MTPDSAGEDLWNWANKVYTDELVKISLLTLQDRYHLHVNRVLWAIWSAERGWEISESDAQFITSGVHDFVTYGVDRLRAVRRYLTSPKPDMALEDLSSLRSLLLDCELKAEYMVLKKLASLTVEHCGPPGSPPAPQEIADKAKEHFLISASRLEKPLFLDDESDSNSQAQLFDQILQQVQKMTLPANGQGTMAS